MTLLTKTQTVLDQIIFFFLCLFVLFLPYGSAVIEVTINVSVFFWIVMRTLSCLERWPIMKVGNSFIKVLACSFKPKKTFLDKPIVCFLIACVFSIFFTDYKDMAIAGFFRKTLEWFFIYYLFTETINTYKRITIVSIIFSVAAFFVGLDAIYQYYFSHVDVFNGIGLDSGRATGPFKHANSLAAYLATVIPISLVIFLKEQKKNIKWIFLLLLATSTFGVFLSLSRSSWVAVAVSIFLFIFVVGREFINFRNVVVLFVILAGLYFLIPKSSLQVIRLDRVALQQGFEWRTGIWADTIDVIKAKPIVGHGLNTYMVVSQDFRRWQSVGVLGQSHPFHPSYAHNCFLQVFAEVGFLGFMGFIWMMSKILSYLWICRSYYLENKFVSFYFVGILFGVIVYLLHSLTDVHFYSLKISAHFWYLVALLAVIINLKNKQTIE